MTQSLRNALRQFGYPRSGGNFPTVPQGFSVCPASLSAFVQATADPRVAEWTIAHEGTREDSWTDGLQGVATDGQFYYFSQSHDPTFGTAGDAPKRIIWKRDLQLNEVACINVQDLVSLPLDQNGKLVHLGDIDYHSGCLYAPLEDNVTPRYLVIDLRGEPKVVMDYVVNDPSHKQQSNPWCAVHPWTGLVYSSNFDAVKELYIYDPNQRFQKVAALQLYGADIDGVQGGKISVNGNIVMASDGYDEIRVFSTMDGSFRGKVHVEKQHKSLIDAGQEIEGLCIWKGLVDSEGRRNSVHLLLQEIHWSHSDKLFFKHYTVPDESVL